MSRALVLRPTAKINLTLRVGPRGDDGWHEVQTLMQSIALWDTLTFTARRGPLVVATRAPGVPADRANLVWMAAAALWRALGRTGDPRDVHVRLEKAIPVAGGLGGGSADAAAALVALNRLWDGGQSRRDLAGVARTIGADVPFFLQGGTALGTGRGDEVYPVDDLARLGVVLVKPSFGVATADAYRWLDEDRAQTNRSVDLSISRSSEDRPGAGRIDVAPPDLDVGWAAAGVRLGNDLEGPVSRRHPVIAEIVEACRRQGALAAAMSGSGSAVFALYSEASARRVVARLRRSDWLVRLTRTITRREAERHMGV